MRQGTESKCSCIFLVPNLLGARTLLVSKTFHKNLTFLLEHGLFKLWKHGIQSLATEISSA